MYRADQPGVSVVIPTYRRHAMLPRAVESVLAQTLSDWELIVSDDEREENESRGYIRRLAERDGRVRLVVNEGPRGQAGNLNHAMRAARGAWIKPVFDDDELVPECLERMLHSVARCPGAVLARCLREKRRGSGAARREPVGRRARLELLRGNDALLALYVQDVEIGTPTQLLIRRAAVHGGEWFPTHDRIVGAMDELWYTRLLRHGDLLLVNEVLAVDYQTGHDSITSRLTPEAFDEEMMLLREIQRPLVGDGASVPSVEQMKQALLVQRGLWRLKTGRVIDGVRMLASARERTAWRIATRWALRRALPGRFEKVAREVVSTESPPPATNSAKTGMLRRVPEDARPAPLRSPSDVRLRTAAEERA